MKLPNILKWKYSAVIIVVTGLGLCYITYRLGLIRGGNLNSREELVYQGYFILKMALRVSRPNWQRRWA